MSMFNDVKVVLNDRSNRMVDETSRLINSLVEDSKQDEYISAASRLMVTKYEPMILALSDQILDISLTTNDISVQYVKQWNCS